ncbi:MAG: hypothetical protein JNK05_14525 [Myxococcales bacterium]|nr:hypothetical protein [Myxococcales bacterium]
MATLDLENNTIVLRIVYDGPAAAGKTTSVRSLGVSLGRDVVTPREAGERTLYFDWMDYTGGRFEGMALRCQVVSVPGQQLLSRRRNAILRTADVVVYVTHVTEENLSDTLDTLTAVRAIASSEEPVPAAVVLQANKQDLGTSPGRDALRTACERAGLSLGIVESIATRGSGVREAFVLAVRFALDRVKELRARGALREGPAAVDAADALLQWVEREDIADQAPAAPVITAPELSKVFESAEPIDATQQMLREGETTRVPDDSVPTGMVWPPIDGRAWIADATRMGTEALARNEGGWLLDTPHGWRLQSPIAARFATSHEARAALVSWARFHTQHAALLSRPRALAVVDDGRGAFRLWQLFRREPSLREHMAEQLDQHDPAAVAKVVLEAARLLVEADTAVRATRSPVRVTIDNVGQEDGLARFVGLFPSSPDELGDDPLRVLEGFRGFFRDFRVDREELFIAMYRLAQRRGDEAALTIVRRLEALARR